MKILFLGGTASVLADVLDDHEVMIREDVLDLEEVTAFEPQLLLSFGYRFRVSEEILGLPNLTALNVHVSLLPWNGGADPNLWSWLTNTPKGVTIHWMTGIIDQGDCARQIALDLNPEMTLRETYDILQEVAQGLVRDLWPAILAGEVPREPLAQGGSYHRLRDKEGHATALTAGWDTMCKDVQEYGRCQGLWERDRRS